MTLKLLNLIDVNPAQKKRSHMSLTWIVVDLQAKHDGALEELAGNIPDPGTDENQNHHKVVTPGYVMFPSTLIFHFFINCKLGKR